MIASLPVLERKIDKSAESSLNKTLSHHMGGLRVNVMFSRGLCVLAQVLGVSVKNVRSLRPRFFRLCTKVYTRSFVALNGVANI